jgi:hypothetical protein
MRAAADSTPFVVSDNRGHPFFTDAIVADDHDP